MIHHVYQTLDGALRASLWKNWQGLKRVSELESSLAKSVGSLKDEAVVYVCAIVVAVAWHQVSEL